MNLPIVYEDLEGNLKELYDLIFNEFEEFAVEHVGRLVAVMSQETCQALARALSAKDLNDALYYYHQDNRPEDVALSAIKDPKGFWQQIATAILYRTQWAAFPMLLEGREVAELKQPPHGGGVVARCPYCSVATWHETVPDSYGVVQCDPKRRNDGCGRDFVIEVYPDSTHNSFKIARYGDL